LPAVFFPKKRLADEQPTGIGSGDEGS